MTFVMACFTLNLNARGIFVHWTVFTVTKQLNAADDINRINLVDFVEM